MIIASYDTEKNQQINCNCKQFGHEIQYIKSWKDITTHHIIFCVDNQAVTEDLKGYKVYDLKDFKPIEEDLTVVFGLNSGMKIGHEAIEAINSGKDVVLITIPNKVLWAESAMAIILYKFSKG